MGFLESRTTNLLMNSLVFSSWTKMLDLVERLDLNGFTYKRVDGQSSLQKRRSAIHQFNEDPRCTVMLASIGSAGEGYVFCFRTLIFWSLSHS